MSFKLIYFIALIFVVLVEFEHCKKRHYSQVSSDDGANYPAASSKSDRKIVWKKGHRWYPQFRFKSSSEIPEQWRDGSPWTFLHQVKHKSVDGGQLMDVDAYIRRSEKEYVTNRRSYAVSIMNFWWSQHKDEMLYTNNDLQLLKNQESPTEYEEYQALMKEICEVKLKSYLGDQFVMEYVGGSLEGASWSARERCDLHFGDQKYTFYICKRKCTGYFLRARSEDGKLLQTVDYFDITSNKRLVVGKSPIDWKRITF